MVKNNIDKNILCRQYNIFKIFKSIAIKSVNNVDTKKLNYYSEQVGSRPINKCSMFTCMCYY